MDNYRKIQLGLAMIVLFAGLFFLFNNPRVITGFFLYSPELNAPHNFINESDIIVYPDKIVLNISNYTLSRYSFSKSMVPVFDSNANGVGIKPQSPDELNVGDIIIFHDGENLIVHRIIEKGTDKKGLFFITKGDNNDIADNKIRFSQIESRLVAIIY